MDIGRRNRPLITTLIVAVVVGLVAYGLGVTTMYLASGQRPFSTDIASTDSPTGSANGNPNNSGSTQTGQPEEELIKPKVPKELEEEFESFWNTYQAIS